MFDGGSIISFELKSLREKEKKVAFSFLNKLKLIEIAVQRKIATKAEGKILVIFGSK